jgi:hypothetical protein
MATDEVKFYGLVLFAGMDQLPDDIILSLGEIRKWAFNEGLVTDPEFQFLVDDRVVALSGHFEPEDKLHIALAIHPGGGEPFYFEYPYLPVRSLIRRGDQIQLQYWQMRPTRWDRDGNILQYEEARFGFIVPGCTEEICSISTAKRIVEKLGSFLEELSDQYQIERFSDGSKEITVDGGISATFFKEGRYYDIVLAKKK